MITFEDARNTVASHPSVREFFGAQFAVADYGWQNDDAYLMAIVVPEDSGAVFDAPDLLVDKRTGELRQVFGMLGDDPVPNLVPIGDPPD